jgi:hypothetical protein
MFEKEDAERKGKPVQRNYLGLYGRAGVGKTTICCEAMCNYYQEKYHGRFCRVRLDSEKCGEGKFADGQAAATKRRLARLMAVIKQLAGVPKSMSTIMTENEVINKGCKLALFKSLSFCDLFVYLFFFVFFLRQERRLCTCL